MNELENYFKDKIDWKFFNYLKDKATQFEDDGWTIQIAIELYDSSLSDSYPVYEYVSGHEGFKTYVGKNTIGAMINIYLLNGFIYRIRINSHARIYNGYRDSIKNKCTILKEQGTSLFIIKPLENI